VVLRGRKADRSICSAASKGCRGRKLTSSRRRPSRPGWVGGHHLARRARWGSDEPHPGRSPCRERPRGFRDSEGVNWIALWAKISRCGPAARLVPPSPRRRSLARCCRHRAGPGKLRLPTATAAIEKAAPQARLPSPCSTAAPDPRFSGPIADVPLPPVFNFVAVAVDAIPALKGPVVEVVADLRFLQSPSPATRSSGHRGQVQPAES